jgi:hypothetical protein
MVLSDDCNSQPVTRHNAIYRAEFSQVINHTGEFLDENYQMKKMSFIAIRHEVVK